MYFFFQDLHPLSDPIVVSLESVYDARCITKYAKIANAFTHSIYRIFTRNFTSRREVIVRKALDKEFFMFSLFQRSDRKQSWFCKTKTAKCVLNGNLSPKISKFWIVSIFSLVPIYNFNFYLLMKKFDSIRFVVIFQYKSLPYNM